MPYTHSGRSITALAYETIQQGEKPNSAHISAGSHLDQACVHICRYTPHLAAQYLATIPAAEGRAELKAYDAALRMHVLQTMLPRDAAMLLEVSSFAALCKSVAVRMRYEARERFSVVSDLLHVHVRGLRARLHLIDDAQDASKTELEQRCRRGQSARRLIA